MNVLNQLASGGTSPASLYDSYQRAQANTLNRNALNQRMTQQKTQFDQEQLKNMQDQVNQGLVQLVGEVGSAPEEARPQLWQQSMQRISKLHPALGQHVAGMQYDPQTFAALEGGLRERGLLGGGKEAALTINQRDANSYKTDPAFREYVDRPQRIQPLSPNQDPDLKRKQAEATAAGKAAGELGAEKDKKAYNATEALAVIDEIERLLPKATGSGAGAMVDATARFFGGTTDGAAAARKLKVLSPQLILKIPRMEGPQSDKDTLLYREAAGNLGDDTLTTEERMAALQTLRALNERYAHLNGGPAAQSQQPAPRQFKVIRKK